MDSIARRSYTHPHFVGTLLAGGILLADIACAHLTPPPPNVATQLTIRPGVSVTVGPDWQRSGQKYVRGYELVRIDPDESRRGGPTPPYPSHLARIVITTEPRSGHDDALQRLRDIARSHDGELSFYAIGGWPAVEVRFRERLPLPGIEGVGASSPAPLVSRALVAVATPALLVDFDIWLAPETNSALLDEAVAMAKTTTFAQAEGRDELARDIDALKRWARNGRPGWQTPQLDSGAAGHSLIYVHPGRAKFVQGGAGELEIVSSPDASNIVIGGNAGLTYSTNFGGTFGAGDNGGYGVSDPTLARGSSGNFYLGVMTLSGRCADAVSVSNDNGANFHAVGRSAECPTTGSICLPDQPHIAADSFNPSSQGTDQLYAVWRNFTPTPCLSCPPTCQSLPASNEWQTSVIACSQDGGATWTAPAPLPGGGDHPRVAVGADGSVYAVVLDGRDVKLSRFSSCSAGLELDSGFPVTVANDAGVKCPEPGIDRCNDSLSSPTVAPDPNAASHVFVTYARHIDDGDFEWIYSRESNDWGLRFASEQILSERTHTHRFMPWSCSTLGTVFVGWFDRGAAVGGATNDLTNYMVGSPIFPGPVNLSENPDPQCASGWSSAPRDEHDSEDCTAQPQKAGFCDNGSHTGSMKRCDFSDGGCPSGESCQKGGGQPKYGDYNGIACAGNNVIAAWSSATAPPGLSPVGGLSIFSRLIPLFPTTPPMWDRLRFDVLTGQDDLRFSSELTATISSEPTPICLKPSTKRPPDAACPNNGSAATDKTGRTTWDNGDGVISQTFTLAAPQSSVSGFGNMNIALTQGPVAGYTSDNWNIEGITVTAIDSTSVLPPMVLLDVTSGAGHVDKTSCIARLKDAPNARAAIFSLESPPTNLHTYVGGPSAGSTTMCSNNGE